VSIPTPTTNWLCCGTVVADEAAWNIAVAIWSAFAIAIVPTSPGKLDNSGEVTKVFSSKESGRWLGDLSPALPHVLNLTLVDDAAQA
jgi:hypothetical protein